MLRLKSILGAENIYQSCGKGINKKGKEIKKTIKRNMKNYKNQKFQFQKINKQQ